MKRVRNWDKVATLYDLGLRALFLPAGGEQRVRTRFLALAGLSEGMLVLDLCCATGRLTRLAGRMTGPAGRAIGIDSSIAMVAWAAGRGNRTAFVCADAAALPFASERFDRVLAFLALHELDDAARDAAIREAHRILKPGGRLVVGEYPVNPKGAKGMLLRAVLKIVEPPWATRILDGRHLETIGSLFHVESTERYLRGLGEVTTALKKQ